MRWVERVKCHVRMLIHRSRESKRLDAELQFHIEQQMAENLGAGMSVDEARRGALRSFGNPTLYRERTREAWSWIGAELFLQDVRYGIRTLSRTPMFSTIAILLMGLGIGATVALFTVVDAVLLKPLPFPHQDRLVMVYESELRDRANDNSVAGGTFKSWEEENHDFSSMALITEDDFNLSGSNGQLPERVHIQFGSWNLLSTLGVQPILGRLFTAADDVPGGPKTTVITWNFWKRRFGGSSNAVGSTMRLNANVYTIIGVLPEWLHYPDSTTQLWATIYPLVLPKDLPAMDSHSAHNFRVIGRVKPGISLIEAEAELSSISSRVEKRFSDNAFVLDAANVHPLVDSLVGNMRTALYTMLGASGCLLLIACLNIASLFVARAATRRKEAAVRAALGASRSRRLRGQVIESILISLCGSLLGMVIAYGAVRWLLFARPDMPRADSIHVDVLALVMAITIAATCGFFSGLIPALMEKDSQVLQTLQDSSRSYSGGLGRVRLRRALLSIEVGLTAVLLIGAGLLLKSYARLHAVDIGCNQRNVLTLGISLPEAIYDNPSKRILFFDRLLERVRDLPGVTAVGISTVLPGQGQLQDDGYNVHDDPPLSKGQSLDADVRFVDPGYFAAMQIPLKSGRTFLPEERSTRNRYAIISESLAHSVFKGRDPIGRHIDDENNAQDENKNVSNEIVGVIGDTRETPAKDPSPTIYYPLYGGQRTDAQLVVRTLVNPLNVATPIQKIVADMDPNLAVANIMTLDQIIGKSTVDASLDATLLSAFATLSLVLAGVGLFGVLSYVVAQRTGEIGIRIALGAQRQQILRLVLVDGLRPAIVGMTLGLVASAALAHFLASLLYGTQPLDVIVYSVVVALLMGVAAVACALPAWQASRVDPMATLRTE